MAHEHGQWAFAHSPEVQGSALGVAPEDRADAEADGRSREAEPRVPLLLRASRQAEPWDPSQVLAKLGPWAGVPPESPLLPFSSKTVFVCRKMAHPSHDEP